MREIPKVVRRQTAVSFTAHVEYGRAAISKCEMASNEPTEDDGVDLGIVGVAKQLDSR